MDATPVRLTAALRSFDEVYSPRIVTRVNDYDVKIAHASGEHVWHVHADTDRKCMVVNTALRLIHRGKCPASSSDMPGRGYGRVCPWERALASAMMRSAS